jgi:porphobilinogen synthase
MEGADMVMVKPGYPYLDILLETARDVAPDHPVAVYQVSGEYSMLCVAIEKGLMERRRAVVESLSAYRRAGARIIITYFTAEILQWLRNGSFSE